MRTQKNLLEQKRDDVNRQIFKEFEKSEADIEECVRVLKDWLKTQPHLPETPSDNQLLQFLNFNKYSVEKVKEKIDMYYTVRTLIPDFFEDANPISEKMQRQSVLTHCVPLPTLAPNNCRIIYTKFTEECTVDETYIDRYCAQYFNFLEILMQEDYAMGLIIVFDCVHFKAGQIPKFNLMVLKKASFVMERVYANRINGIYMINAPPYIDLLVTILKAALPQKLSRRIQVHKTAETLFDLIPKEILPKDIGGNEAPSSDLYDLWQEKIATYQDRFDKLDKLKVNEELRPAPLVNDEILGYYGNFKKIAVD